MIGKRIEMAKQCLIYFFKSLQENGSKFNIICYGTKFYSIFKKNKLVNDENINMALNLVLEFKGDMGGNELENPLKYIKDQLIENNLLNRIFVMTDGAVWDIDDCLELVKDTTFSSGYDCKFYSIGIGNGCSESLVRGIALSGDGECDFVKNEENISDKIIYLLESSMYYCLNNFKCNLKKYDDNIIKRFDYSSRLNSNIELYTLLNNPVLLKDNSIICSFSFNNKEYNIEKKLELNQSTTSDTLHKLFLKSYIDANPNFSSEELAIKYQILTNDTAFYCLFQENNLTDEELLNKKYREIENIPPIEHLIKKKEKIKKRYREIESFQINESFISLKEEINANSINNSYSFKNNKIHLIRKSPFSENYNKNKLDNIFEKNQSFEHYKNNSQIFPGLPELINIKVILDNNYSFTYKIIGLNRVIKETASEMIINVCKNLKIYDNSDEYNFYYEEKNSLEGNKLNYLVYNIFGEEGTLTIKSKKKYINISKEDNLIMEQKMNGLWEISDYVLFLLYIKKEKWNNILNKDKNKIKEIFNKNIDKEAIFNIVVLCYFYCILLIKTIFL